MDEKEKITIKPAGQDKFEITRVITEVKTGKEIADILKQIEAGISENQKHLKEIPGQIEARTKALRDSLNVLVARKNSFEPVASKYREKEEPKDAQKEDLEIVKKIPEEQATKSKPKLKTEKKKGGPGGLDETEEDVKKEQEDRPVDEAEVKNPAS